MGTNHMMVERNLNDDLLNEITGLVGICPLPEPNDLSEYVSNELSEDEDSDEIIIVFCAIWTDFSSLIASIHTGSSSLIAS